MYYKYLIKNAVINKYPSNNICQILTSYINTIKQFQPKINKTKFEK